MSSDESTCFETAIENLLVVTHAVPAERVRLHVPGGLELDLIKGPEDEDVALVSATCFLNTDFHWPGTHSAFHQSTYVTYTRPNGEAGVYILANFLERGTPLLERLAVENSYPADFDVSLSYDPSSRSYGTYYCEILSDHGDTIIQVRSAGGEPEVSMPFTSPREMAMFITHRLTACFPMAGGGLGIMSAEHEEMDPVGAELLAGQFDLWEKLGILRLEESELPYSVLIQPRIALSGHFPIPTR